MYLVLITNEICLLEYFVADRKRTIGSASGLLPLYLLPEVRFLKYMSYWSNKYILCVPIHFISVPLAPVTLYGPYISFCCGLSLNTMALCVRIYYL